MLSARVLSRTILLGVLAVMGLSGSAHSDPLGDRLASSQTNWRKDMGRFRIGVAAPRITELNPAEIARLKSAYATALGMPVELVILRDIPALIDAQATERIDYAMETAAAYAAAYAACECVEPLVAPVGVDGSLGIRSILLLRKGVDEKDLKSAHIALPGDAAKASGFIPISTYMLAGNDTPVVRDNFINAGSTENAEKLFASGKIDGFFGWVPASGNERQPRGGTLSRLTRQGLAKDGYRIAWESSLLRYGPHAVRANLAPEAKLILRRFLVSLSTRDPETYDLLDRVHGGGFVAVGTDDYRLPLKMLSAITGQAKEL
ncbi:phosphonate ABC transporter substrate-binding protein [Phyllobacterium salinisoli]|uniref:Phosphonate ABC transporter substrate-binding protein n=1 Tax=Phyllobacterium salinisoli TaxID=1899321 RepID=A0A368K6J9_9HYPH|nr:PhnD/SsuA/transferrin family substrate-binding protein [Phyllobacterium salinisoli]RCS25018.1 phosphonate ABC transporter substrate-binding protein [Phyllobacterium salinisoli]